VTALTCPFLDVSSQSLPSTREEREDQLGIFASGLKLGICRSIMTPILPSVEHGSMVPFFTSQKKKRKIKKKAHNMKGSHNS
jgi:hypothetical protein